MPIDPNWEPPRLTERKRNAWKIVLAIIVVLFVVLYVAYLIASPKVVTQKETAAPASQGGTSPAVEKQAFKSEAPEFDSKCTVVAGIVPGSIVNQNNKISFTFRNSGKSTIEGSYFEASNEAKKAYRKNMESLAPGAEATYSIDLNDVSSEVGIAVKSFIVLPVQNSKACLNQRMIIIK
ncbi:TPA: hypothetical protein HA219_03255 [Candidatus Woesearchaeota archaeon]|nr:hypothetical protein [Candidatus Woesearchaeota archaeon]HIH39710.1 hypothetical protein [Candidatus Woesearchaeota archaeon]